MNKSAVIYIGLAVVILIGLFWVFSPGPAQAPEADAPQAFAFTIREGQRTAGPELMQVPQGTEVRLIVNADSQDELHVHGYDLQVEVAAGESSMLSFTADRAGRFEVELHGAHAQLSVLQVQPTNTAEQPPAQ